LGAPGTTRPIEAEDYRRREAKGEGTAYMDLLLIRHAQSQNNLVWAQTGASVGRVPDPRLTPLGERQAAAVAHALARGRYAAPPTVLYASLMSRAILTAAPIAAALDLDLHGHPELFEVGGPLDWSGHEDVPRRAHPGAGRTALTQLSSRLKLPHDAGDDGWWNGPVEPDAGAAERACRVLDGILERHGGTDAVVGVVSHGHFSQFLVRALLGIPTMTGWVDILNTSVSRFSDVDVPGRTAAAWINRVEHLLPDEVSD